MEIGSLLIYTAGIIWGIELIPQIRKTYTTKNIDGVSLSFFSMCLVAYILYAFGNYFQQNWAVLISHIPSLILNSVMVFFIIKYKKENSKTTDKIRIAFDLDGCLSEHIRDNNDSDILWALPINEKVDLLNELKRKLDCEITIFTRRGITKKGHKYTKDWLKIHNIPYDKLVSNKPGYDILFDDRSVCCFDRDWTVEKTLKQLNKIQKNRENTCITKGK